MPDWLELLDWLLAPVRIGPAEPMNAIDRWHVELMATAAAVWLPVMVLITRYWKVLPSQAWPRVLDNRLWWRAHLTFGYASALAILVGAGLAFHGMSIVEHLLHAHAWFGWLAVLLLVVLIVTSGSRGTTGGPGRQQPGTLGHLHERAGDHYDMTPRRRRFERVHKALGYLLLSCLGLALVSGIWHVNASRIALLGLAGWWLLLLGLAWHWERQGRAVDGYQAKWGPAMMHPGNRIPTLGWGSRRYTEASFRRQRWVRSLAADPPAQVQPPAPRDPTG